MPLPQLEDLIRSGQYAGALRAFLEVLKDEELSRQELARAYHCASIARYHMEEVFSALELGRLAEEHAVVAGDAVLLGRIWINMIGFYRRVGDTHMALEYGEKWLSSKGMFPELANQEGKVHYNLALVQRNRKNDNKAIHHFKAAILLMERDRLPNSMRVMAHQMCSWVLYEHGQISEGDTQLDVARALIAEDDQEAVREQILLKCLRAYQLGEFKTVCNLAEEILAPGITATTIQRFWATWMLGFVAAKLGQTASATAMALLAKDLAMRTKLSEHMNRVSELQRYIHTYLNSEGSAG